MEIKGTIEEKIALADFLMSFLEYVCTQICSSQTSVKSRDEIIEYGKIYFAVLRILLNVLVVLLADQIMAREDLAGVPTAILGPQIMVFGQRLHPTSDGNETMRIVITWAMREVDARRKQGLEK
jgi:hypothetical protein